MIIYLNRSYKKTELTFQTTLEVLSNVGIFCYRVFDTPNRKTTADTGAPLVYIAVAIVHAAKIGGKVTILCRSPEIGGVSYIPKCPIKISISSWQGSKARFICNFPCSR